MEREENKDQGLASMIVENISSPHPRLAGDVTLFFLSTVRTNTRKGGYASNDSRDV